MKHASKELKKSKERVKVMYYHVILNKYQLIEDESMWAEWSYLINKFRNATIKSSTLREEMTADSENRSQIIWELLSQYDKEKSDAILNDSDKDSVNVNKESSIKSKNEKERNNSELIESQKKTSAWCKKNMMLSKNKKWQHDEKPQINNNKCHQIDLNSDDLRELSVDQECQESESDSGVKVKYNTVLEIAWDLDEMLYKQLSFEKKLFTDLSKILSAAKLFN